MKRRIKLQYSRESHDEEIIGMVGVDGPTVVPSAIRQWNVADASSLPLPGKADPATARSLARVSELDVPCRDHHVDHLIGIADLQSQVGPVPWVLGVVLVNPARQALQSAEELRGRSAV